jgi:hypothetical protein
MQSRWLSFAVLSIATKITLTTPSLASQPRPPRPARPARPARFAVLFRLRTRRYLRKSALVTMLLAHVPSFGRFDATLKSPRKGIASPLTPCVTAAI